MDLSKLSKSDKIIGVGAIAGLVAGFLPWWSWSVDFGIWGGASGGSVSGFTGWISLSPIAAGAALALIALPLFGVKIPKIGIETNMLYMILGAVTAGIALLALLGVGRNSYSGAGGSAGASFGVFVAIAAGAIILLGAFTAKKEGGVKSPPQPQGPQTPQEPQA